MRTYGGREAEGAQGATFSPEMSEIIYWQLIREDKFWDRYMDDLEIVLDVKRKYDRL
ncbi:hypothetical protein HVTV1_163 [Haloarcula vallismortis tailed virus 1]|uniref:Uncharacterized protein n=1 Tax=Haloarcula vallismortis tailed virus 1 TaxID=1262528 RepID=L7TNW1_9CAUD|nr:hypothetical protein HVTV1_163 [Haloarcula vallismortis tailed virus 1]AGC34532.1 hypothetical protein HVTV1_163 [Haloarcula vallismortis tailed virus 1]